MVPAAVDDYLAYILQIRCTEERPVCKRCARLKHQCVYSDAASEGRINRPISSRISKSNRLTRKNPSDISSGVVHISTREAILDSSNGEHYLGIPSSLLTKLIEVYFDNVYNASLLLHKQTFIDSLAAGMARSHVVLSVCAFAAKYIHAMIC